MTLQVVVAARGGPEAKTRLADRLDTARRGVLVEAMLADMLEALSRTPEVTRVCVSTPTPALARLAARAGALVMLEAGPQDLNGAFAHARRHLAADRADAPLLLLPGDLPRLSPADVAACRAAWRPDALVLAPASADGGTGGLLFRADIDLPLAFGPGSFGKHLAAARGANLAAEVVHAPGLELDLDRPADLDAFLALGGGARSTALLRAWRAAA